MWFSYLFKSPSLSTGVAPLVLIDFSLSNSCIVKWKPIVIVVPVGLRLSVCISMPTTELPYFNAPFN